jgi:hypothetical protein
MRQLLSTRFPKIFGGSTGNEPSHSYQQSREQSSKRSRFRSTDDTDVEAEPSWDKDLNLGDRMKGGVLTNVVVGSRRNSDVELVDRPTGIVVVNTQTIQQGRAHSSRSWAEEDSLRHEQATELGTGI